MTDQIFKCIHKTNVVSHSIMFARKILVLFILEKMKYYHYKYENIMKEIKAIG